MSKTDVKNTSARKVSIVRSGETCEDLSSPARTERIHQKQCSRAELSNLMEEYKLLQHKNSMLKQLVTQLNREKAELGKLVQRNVEQLVLPMVARLESGNPGIINNELTRLKKTLQEITSPFLPYLEKRYNRLTPREVEICRLIKEGMTSRQIAVFLNCSIETIRSQRKNIRRKFGLTKNKTNLATFLNTI